TSPRSGLPPTGSEATPRSRRANGERAPADSRAMNRRAFILSAGGAVVAVAIVLVLVLTGRGTPPPATTGTATVSRGTVTLQVSASGTVAAAQQRGLSFTVAGTVTEVDVKAGDLVKSGQVLARIDPTDAQAAVDSAQSRVSDASDAVDRAEA